ncbi:MAG: zinc carboxypeptidase [Chitinophagaceae bacterium]|nr:zinc carboxypeptidase [Chitinophagaceae bacterium]MCW5904996.1 zinc carboxypeptidase [Chitinophagaceae bacterium]
MNKKITFVFGLLLMFSFTIAQTLQSPDEFLGYKLGTQFTRHHKIVEYVKYVAATKKDMVKAEQYGTTYEGRELMLVYISSAENMQNLEAIRNNNLKLTGIAKDNAKAQTNNAPAIVWFSYNVHGNEPSSSEAAMQTLFELVNPANKQTKEWLKNTVIIIDPCANPDGRDRYVNWFNQVVGIHSNTDPQSREHSEPWPNGRSNHYNFDLNRDWAWQTQVESQQRIKKYNQWMPQVHVDFHEQYYDNPYYFAPAAEPFHEVITPWQRTFQEVIGKNHAKYFDANGWLYFTKESFDLFYPSYGDTYPIYNGSIGMTYEQAGHSRGGLAVTKSDGEVLTLADRVAHHFTSGISTIEVASTNATKIVNEFAKYFEDAVAGKNVLYKTYILTSDNKSKIAAIKKLLTANGILFGTTNTINTKGYNYQLNKEADVKALKYTIAVSSCQPKGVLANVLLEPKSKLSDSATYDITAWSIGYAYGVNTYALKEKKDINYAVTLPAEINNYQSNYGYLITYNSVNSVKALTYLLQHGIKVRYSEKPFVYKGKNYERGTLIAIKSGNNIDSLNNTINALSTIYDVEINAVETGFMDKGLDFGSPSVKQINNAKILLLTGDGVSSLAAGEIWHFFDRELNYPITLINANDFNRVNVKNYQTIIMPDGYYKFLNDKNAADKLKDFIANGGKLIAVESAVEQLAKLEIGIKSKNEKDKEAEKEDYSLLKKYADREKDFLPSYVPGAIYKIELDNTHPLAFGYDSIYYTLKTDANIYDFMKDGWNVGILKTENYVTGFAGYKVKEKLKDGTVLGAIDYGKGSCIFFAENPLFRLFWENGKLLFSNAVFLTGNN